VIDDVRLNDINVMNDIIIVYVDTKRQNVGFNALY